MYCVGLINKLDTHNFGLVTVLAIVSVLVCICVY